MSSLYPAYFDRFKDYLPTIPSIDLGKFIPPNTARNCAVATTALQFLIGDLVPAYPFVWRASVLGVLCLGGVSIAKSDIRYFTAAIMINNLTNLFFKTESSILFSMLYAGGCIAKKIFQECQNRNFSSPSSFADASSTSLPDKRTLEMTPETLPRITDHLDKQFYIQKKERDKLAKAIISHYSDAKIKTIALKGPKNCEMTAIIKEIAKELNIQVITINKETTTLGFKLKTINNEEPYILIHELEEKPISVDHFNIKAHYESSNFLNIFISNHPEIANQQKISEQIDEFIEFPCLTKEDFNSLLYTKTGNNPSFYTLQKALSKKNRLLNVDEIPDEVTEKCLERIVGSQNPWELNVVIKELQKIILNKYSHEDDQNSIPVHLDSLPDHFVPRELTMTSMKAVLDERIVGQDEAKQAIIEAIFFHHHSNSHDNKAKLPKGNVLLIGPSGTGKTYIVETIAHFLNIPVASMDLSRVTREGYIGPKISEVFEQLIDSASGDLEKAGKGIVFFDEADKIFEDSANGRNEITGLPIQNQLLCMLQGDRIRVGGKNNHEGGIFLNTQNILFIFAGAFHKQTSSNHEGQLDEKQLIACGLRPEFLGRIGYITQLSALSHTEIKKILSHGPNAPLTIWKKEFEKFGFRVIIKEETLNQIVMKAMQKETGARSLQYEMRRKLSNLLAVKIMEQESLGIKPRSNELQIVEV